jgi:ubiquinone/menaquinone biosynthesis C-methylase UbiE
VLDAGCGTGVLALWFLRRFPQARVIAFDLDPRMLALLWRSARRREADLDRLTIARGDLRQPARVRPLAGAGQLELGDRSFDLIAVGAALEHVPLAETLAELRRLLRPDGRILILGVRAGRIAALLGRLYRFRAYPIAQFRQALERTGFTDVQIQPLGPRDFPANLTRIAILARRP